MGSSISVVVLTVRRTITAARYPPPTGTEIDRGTYRVYTDDVLYRDVYCKITVSRSD